MKELKRMKRELKCILNKSACVVANACVEIYYRLILSTLLDYSYIHIASNIRNCISFWVLACKSHHVKFPTITVYGEHSFVKLCQVDTLNVFAVFEIRNCSICVTFTLTHIMSNPLRETCALYFWECMSCEIWIETVGCCYGMHNDWFLGNTTLTLLHLNLSIYCT